MDLDVVVQVARLAVILRDGAVLVAGDDVLAEVAPPGHGGFALLAHNGELLLVALLGLDVDLDVQHDDGAQVPHALLGHAQQLGAVLVELDPLDGCGEVPCLEALARLDVPEADGVVGRARGEDGGGGVDVDGPDGALVAAICAEALAVVGEPGADLLIFGDGEDDVAFAVVSVRKASQSDPDHVLLMMQGDDQLDLGQGTFVARQQDGPHFGHLRWSYSLRIFRGACCLSHANAVWQRSDGFCKLSQGV